MHAAADAAGPDDTDATTPSAVATTSATCGVRVRGATMHPVGELAFAT